MWLTLEQMCNLHPQKHEQQQNTQKTVPRLLLVHFRFWQGGVDGFCPWAWLTNWFSDGHFAKAGFWHFLILLDFSPAWWSFLTLLASQAGKHGFFNYCPLSSGAFTLPTPCGSRTVPRALESLPFMLLPPWNVSPCLHLANIITALELSLPEPGFPPRRRIWNCVGEKTWCDSSSLTLMAVSPFPLC